MYDKIEGTMTLVLDMGATQNNYDASGWADNEHLTAPLYLNGVVKLVEGNHEPGWEFSVKFKDQGAALVARSHTSWDQSEEDPTVLYATSAYNDNIGDRRIILTTHASSTARILWRKWSLEI